MTALPVAGITRFEHFFRETDALVIDKSDLKRLGSFLDRKLRDLVLRAGAIAKANGREIVEPYDLPITKGFQERIHEFRTVSNADAVKESLASLTGGPASMAACSDDTEAWLPEVAGGLCLTLSRTFKIIIDPRLKNPQTEHWDRAERLHDLLL